MPKTKRTRRTPYPLPDRPLAKGRIAVPLHYDTFATRTAHSDVLGQTFDAHAVVELELGDGSDQIGVYVTTGHDGERFNFDVTGNPDLIRNVGEALIAAAIQAERAGIFAELRANQAKRGTD